MTAVTTEAVLPATPAASHDAGSPSSQSHKRRVLMLAHRLPYPPDRGDRIRTFHMVKALSKVYDLGLACTSEDPVWLQHHQLMMSMASRVTLQPISMKWGKIKGIQALLRGEAITPAVFYRQTMADTILQWHEKKPFDAVLTVCTSMVEYARRVLNPPKHIHLPTGAPRPLHVLDLMDVDSEKWNAYSQSSSAPMSWVYAAEAARLRKIEAGEFDHYDAITVVSDAEAEAYRRCVGGKARVVVVNNGVNFDYFCPQPESSTHAVVFVGVLNYKPNVDGVRWFAREVMPLLRQNVSDARFLIVGRHPTPKVTELQQIPGVEVIGSVADVRPYIAEASVSIAPLQIARGVQNKVLEAMACRRPVVCSPGAAQGVDATPGEHLLVAESPQQWVDHLTKLFGDPAMRNRLGDAARRRVEQRYSWESCLRPLVDLLQERVASKA